MIFLSHTKSDKPVVHEIAKTIANVFGKENIFYDIWSIQPGDGIIDKMNQGLEKCKYFFFFVSKKSLESDMVKLEWQNALYLKTKNKIKIIPIKLDNCLMPAILSQNLYIDIFGNGIETAVRQMIDVISGNDLSAGENIFHNIKAHCLEKTEWSIKVEFKAEFFMEPQSRYLILVGNDQNNLEYKAIDEGMFNSGFGKFQLDDGSVSNAILIGRDSPTSPGFSFIVEVKTKDQTKLDIKGVMRAISREKYQSIPLLN